MRSPLDLDYSNAVLLVLGVVTLVALLVAASTSTASFGSYNTAWDGASELRAEAEAVGAETVIVRNATAYAEASPDGTIAVILSADDEYDPADASRVRQFVEGGGTLLVAEDVGPHSNALLEDVGADARVDGRPLRDERYNYRSPAMPVARNISNHSLVADVGSLTLNHGTAVEPDGATVLASTSEYAYLDENRNGELDDAENMTGYPVATVESVGEGRVVVVGDPSVAINAMLDRAGNRAFVRGLFGGHDDVLLDYSHADPLPPLVVAVLTLRESALLQLLVGALGVGAVALFGERRGSLERLRSIGDSSRDLSESRTARREDLVAYLREEHPEWSADRIERVVNSLGNDLE